MDYDVNYPADGIQDKQHALDAGFDLIASHDVQLVQNEPVLVHTGLYVAVPVGQVGLVCPRSGLALKGVTVMNAPGIIDTGYRGEVGVVLVNLKKATYAVHRGDRIAQLVLVQYVAHNLNHCNPLTPALDLRDTGGFGSTGE